MKFEKNYVRDNILNNKEIVQAIDNNDFETAFTLCDSGKKVANLAWALTVAGIKFLNYMTYVPDAMFMTNENLSAIDIPENIKRIGEAAFAGCSNLEYVTLHEGLEKIEENAFTGCSKLKEITLPSTIKYLEENCLGKATVYMPSNLTNNIDM